MTLGLAARQGHGQSSLSDALQAKENAISALAAQAQNAFYSRCADRDNCQNAADSCSVPACGSDFPSSRGFTCTTQWGNDAGQCGATTTALVRSLNTSVVRLAKGTNFNDLETQAFVCSSTRMDSTFRTSSALKAWQYTSDTQGAIRLWPGGPQNRAATCSNYDPRLRPWFIAASSGPKDIIMIFDTSGSMLTSTFSGTRHQQVQDALVALLGTLTTNDWVSLISFSDDAEVLGGFTTLQAATAAHISQLQTLVKARTASGGTNFLQPFRKAFQIFSASSETSGCTKVILFLTDGKDPDNGNLAVPEIQTLRAGIAQKVHIFTFSMGTSADKEIPKAIACDNYGVFAVIDDGSDPLSEMRSYFRFIASGFDSDTVRWTTPYEDAFQLGQMVTGARAVYDRRDPTNAILVGVVGADVTIAELERYADFQSIVAALVARGAQCPTLDLSECRMQKLREQDSATESVCPAPAPALSTCTSSADAVDATPCTAAGSSPNLNSMLCTSLNSATLVASSNAKSIKEVLCCGSSPSVSATPSPTPAPTSGKSSSTPVGAIVGGVIGGLAFIALVVLLLCCLMKRSDGHAPAGTHSQSVPNQPFDSGYPQHYRV